MNKKLLVVLSGLLKLDENVLSAEIQKEDGDDSVVKDFKDKYNVFSLDDVKRIKDNAGKAALEDIDPDKLPKEVYDKIYSNVKGVILEKKEKELADKYGIESYKNLNDLIAQLTEKFKSEKGEPDEALLQQIETLKETVKEKETELETERQKITADYVNRDFSSALSTIPLDYDDEVLDKQRNLLSNAFKSEYKLERRNDQTIVLDSEGKPVVDKLGDPMKISDVVKSYAENYGFKFKQDDPGGRGTGSSEDKPSLKGIPFSEALAQRGVKPNTEESDEFHKEWKAANQ